MADLQRPQRGSRQRAPVVASTEPVVSMVDLLKHIEENLKDTRLDGEFSTLNDFQDSDLSMYPAIQIKEQELSANDCEIIANNILNDIESANKETIAKSARALVALAYNSLMDPGRVRSMENLLAEQPLFHKVRYKAVESWFRLCGESDLDLREYSVERPDLKLKLTLTRQNAGHFERKASIGAWAYYYLRLMNNSKSGIWNRSTTENFNSNVKLIYGFDIAFEFPKLRKRSYELLKSRYIYDFSGELLYLLYRSMILFEGDMHREARPQRWLLLDKMVFGYPQGLSDGRMWLWNWLHQASSRRNLNVPVDQLMDDFEWVLSSLDHNDSRFVQYTSLLRRNLANLREFYRKYIRLNPQPRPRPGTSQQQSTARNGSVYFKYARLVNNFYFHFLRLRANREMVCALIYIVEKKSNITIKFKPMRPPYKQWGELMGSMIIRKYTHRESSLSNRFNRLGVSGDHQNRMRQLAPTSGSNWRQRQPPAQPSTSRQPASSGGGAGGGPECPVCMTAFSTRRSEGGKVVLTECGHLFCRQCIDGVIIHSTAECITPSCPRCRKRLSSTRFTEVFDF